KRMGDDKKKRKNRAKQKKTRTEKRRKQQRERGRGGKEKQERYMEDETSKEKAYEEYFEGLADGEEALSFNEFKQALSNSAKSNG
ncbi:hypothetical protein, partial [Escherichia coli]|uniref:hypothetical protein n=1 Tax=Escherichia coli TaxID=562 RepID=UPI00384BEC07